jgi:peptidyl-prolyl cis-trans isomerase D
MSIINTLREKMGRLLVVVVGLSITAFVLTDLVGSKSGMSGNNRDVGEIAGETISQDQFVNYVENIKNNYIQQGVNPNEAMMQNIRNQAWDQMIFDVMYGELYGQVGLTITQDERVDMVQGNNIAPIILQYFGDPATGQLDRNQLNNFLTQGSVDPQARYNWEVTESQIASERIRTKYDNLLLKTNYATLAESQREYASQLASVNIDYAYFPFDAIDDASVTVTDGELNAYLTAHKDEYQVTQSRSIEYTTFEVTPSAADSATYKKDLENIKSQLETTEDDSTFATLNTEQGIGFNTYNPKTLPVDLAVNIAGMKEGDVYGPSLTNGIYSLYKLSGIEDAETKFVKASHILFNTESLDATGKSAARTKANSLLAKIRNGADFAQMARENSEDSSAPVGGDLGWYEENTARDEAFSAAIFGRTRKGLIPRLVESQFGYHIITVEEVPTTKRYKVANIQILLTPSFETRNVVFQQASEFASAAKSYQDFSNISNERGYPVFSGDNIGPNSNIIGSLPDPRQIVVWLYSEAERESVKDFELDDTYVVAVHTNRVEEGTASLASVRTDIENKVKGDKKVELLKARVAALSGTLQEMTTAFGETGKFYTTAILRMNTNSLPNVGTAPEAIGAAHALANAGDRSGVIATSDGVIVIELKSKSEAADIADYTAYENQLMQRMSSQQRYLLAQSMRERASVVDERYKFY